MNSEHLISRQIEEYIAFKKALGFQITVESAELRRFAKYAEEQKHHGSLTVDLVLNWVSQKPSYSRFYKARRLETVHTFAKYAVSIDSKAQMPPKGLFGKCHGRTSPYIYTTVEVKKIIDQANQLLSPDGLRARTMAALIGLLWSTGLRVSEACRLIVDDIDYDNLELHIRRTKFNKERYVPIHESVGDALKKYEAFRNEYHSAEPYFFLSTGGKRLVLRNAEYAFTVIRKCLLPEGTLNWSRRPPRLYDFRHTFASNTIRRWLEEGVDVNHRLLLLSTYLGHVKPSDTYWYLTGTPELLSIAIKKFEDLSFDVGSGGCHGKK